MVPGSPGVPPPLPPHAAAAVPRRRLFLLPVCAPVAPPLPIGAGAGAAAGAISVLPPLRPPLALPIVVLPKTVLPVARPTPSPTRLLIVPRAQAPPCPRPLTLCVLPPAATARPRVTSASASRVRLPVPAGPTRTRRPGRGATRAIDACEVHVPATQGLSAERNNRSRPQCIDTLGTGIVPESGNEERTSVSHYASLPPRSHKHSTAAFL